VYICFAQTVKKSQKVREMKLVLQPLTRFSVRLVIKILNVQVPLRKAEISRMFLEKIKNIVFHLILQIHFIGNHALQTEKRHIYP